jgi:hypothetical protein
LRESQGTESAEDNHGDETTQFFQGIVPGVGSSGSIVDEEKVVRIVAAIKHAGAVEPRRVHSRRLVIKGRIRFDTVCMRALLLLSSPAAPPSSISIVVKDASKILSIRSGYAPIAETVMLKRTLWLRSGRELPP